MRSNSIDVGGGRTITLWLSAAPATVQPWDRTPVVELSVGGSAAQWLITPAPQGTATQATLVCASGGVAVNCAVTAPIGAHSGYGLIVELRDARLVSAPTWLTRSAAETTAADLDHDGYLDLADLNSDWSPDYASGHTYWQTYRFTGTTLVSTGCGPLLATYPSSGPSQLFTGACPAEG